MVRQSAATHSSLAIPVAHADSSSAVVGPARSRARFRSAFIVDIFDIRASRDESKWHPNRHFIPHTGIGLADRDRPPVENPPCIAAKLPDFSPCWLPAAC